MNPASTKWIVGQVLLGIAAAYGIWLLGIRIFVLVSPPSLLLSAGIFVLTELAAVALGIFLLRSKWRYFAVTFIGSSLLALLLHGYWFILSVLSL